VAGELVPCEELLHAWFDDSVHADVRRKKIVSMYLESKRIRYCPFCGKKLVATTVPRDAGGRGE
jgi:hypothetical protein